MKYRSEISPHVRSLVADMDRRVALEQCLCPVFRKVQDQPELRYGGVFFDPGERDEVAAQIAVARARTPLSPFLVADMEMGAGAVLWGEPEFPSLAAAGIVGDETLSRRAGLAAAAAGRAAGGLNWTLAPCVDLMVDRASPMVSIRSAGRQHGRVLATARAYIGGLQAGGCMATAKHFPGDGYSDLDQHLTTVENPLPAEEWWAECGRVYQELIDDGLLAVMSGHIAAPAFDVPDETTGLFPPATISRPLLTELLRGELGFEGLIVSDAVEMGGLVGYLNYYDACARFFMAGGDVLLFVEPDARFFAEMETRFEAGTLDPEVVRRAAERVLAMKEHLGLLAPEPPEPETIAPAETEAAAAEMARRALRIVRDRGDKLPLALPPQSRVLHLVLEQSPRARPDFFAQLTEALRSRFDAVEQWDDPGPDRLFAAARDGAFDCIVCSIAAIPRYGVGHVRLQGPIARNFMGGWMRLGIPVVFVSLGHPCVHEDFAASMDVVVNTYGISPAVVEPLLALLFGEASSSRA